MMFKVLTVAILVVLLSDVYFVTGEPPKRPEGCKKPSNAIKFNVQDLDKKTWKLQQIVGSNNGFQYACAIAEFAKTVGRNCILKSLIIYKVDQDYKFDVDLFEVTQEKKGGVDQGSFVIQNLTDTTMVLYADMIVYDDDNFIESLCVTKDRHVILTGYLLWTKDGDATEEKLKKLRKDNGIESDDIYDVVQSDDCYKYEK